MLRKNGLSEWISVRPYCKIDLSGLIPVSLIYRKWLVQMKYCQTVFVKVRL